MNTSKFENEANDTLETNYADILENIKKTKQTNKKTKHVFVTHIFYA